jgi:hypothetical protein
MWHQPVIMGGFLLRLCRWRPSEFREASVSSATPHLTCGGAADKRVSSDGQAGIVDVNVDDPVQNHRRARGGHEAIDNSFGGGAAVVLPDSNCIG